LSIVFQANDAVASETLTHMIICPGNAGGDAASCASLAVSDRIASIAQAVTTTTFSDNTTSIAYGNSGFQVLTDNKTTTRQEDNSGVLAYFVDNSSKTNAYASDTSLSTDNISATLVLDNGSISSNITFMGSDAYFATADAGATNQDAFDNLTIYKRTDGKGDWAILTEDNASSTTDNASVVQIGSDGTDLFVVHDNGTVSAGLQGHVYLDNGTLLNTGVGSDSAISTLTMCSVATTDKMVVVVDNGSDPGGFDVFTLHDNGTLASTATDSTVTGLAEILDCDLTIASSTYILTLLEQGGDNITVLSSDNLTGWNTVYELKTADTSAVTVSAAAPNGTGDVWVGVDDGTNLDLYHSDNGTSGNLILVHTTTGVRGTIAHDGGAAGSASIGIAVDTGGNTEVDVYFE